MSRAAEKCQTSSRTLLLFFYLFQAVSLSFISVSSLKKAAMTHEEVSFTVPLLENDHKDVLGSKIEDLDPNSAHHTNTSASTVNVFRTCFNGLNALSGVGILSIPYALASGGWLSLVLLFAIATAAFYAGLLIQRCMDADPRIRTYPDIGERAFGNKGRVIATVVMYIELYLVATVAGVTVGGQKGFIIIVALIILPTVWLDNLSLLSYVSASGVLASAVILGSVIWTGAFEGIGFQHKGTLINWGGIPTAVSLYAFCYCSHPVFPTLYTSMKKRHQFSNVLVLCFVLCTICYTSMAIFGYLMFGSDVQSQITLNLPTDKLSARVAIYTTLVNPISKYALMVTPIVNATKAWIRYPCDKRVVNLFVGTTLVISTLLVALAVPFFGSLMSLVGAFLSITASVMLPCIFYLKISGTYQRFNGEFIAVSLIILMSVAVAIFGTYTSVLDMIGKL
ncbi:hypothetical protein ES319_1Z160900v1 [Gossypium barbadense]|uniref:Amino acid transporter transmembrane domain-containing protein n=2 Tax=Gossypium TaxID=3633 RepID=A0A5J5NDB8_GOSBA|nr:hypothetical protein ES319_1Z160900v1 [Gossypium barbadense]TYG93058.1 hypothetical protein ES288_A11G080400v1 [Gossypium darwinii]